LQNITRANEAMFHLTSICDEKMFEDIAVELIGSNADQAYQRVESLYQGIFKMKDTLLQQKQLLGFMIKLRPQEHKLYRFLGSCWRNEFGWQDKRALANFKKAVELEPDRPEYWANYGKSCLAARKEGIFLSALAQYEQDNTYTPGINDFVLSIKADCVKAAGDVVGAMEIRQQQIQSGIDDPVVYADQAKAYLQQNQAAKALEVLALAEKNGANND
jgi:tetratricopeptide (TPR) repeat protein